MKVVIEGHEATLAPEKILKSGGEATIYKDPLNPDGRVLKIYHQPSLEKEKKIRSFLRRFNFSTQGNIIIPLFPIISLDGQFLGFGMRRLNNRYRILNLLFKSANFRADYGFHTKAKCDLFLEIAQDIESMHAQGLIVGDLSSANIMIHDTGHKPAWLDVDSMQFDSFPCPAGTEMYLHPALYNVDLALRPVFKEKYDWWSYTVLLFQALLNGIHPFKSGSHPRWKSLKNRAENGATVLDKEVTYPNIGLSPEILSPELEQVLMGILKQKYDSGFPIDALRDYRDSLTECHACHAWYPAERPHCPVCAHATVLDMAQSLKLHGLNIAEIFTTKGRLIHCEIFQEIVYVICEENQTLMLYQLKDNKQEKIDLGIKPIPGARFGRMNDLLIICPDPLAEEPSLYLLDFSSGRPELLKILTTMPFSGQDAMFSYSRHFLYRIAGRTLLSGERFGLKDLLERPMAQVYEGQTWFQAARDLDQEILIGFHREYKRLRWFMLKGDGRNFSYRDISPSFLSARESLADIAIYFSPDTALLVRKTKKKGAEFIHLDNISLKDGEIMEKSIIDPKDGERWEHIRGKIFWKNFLMHAADQGIVREDIITRQTSDIPFTQRYVEKHDSLERMGNNIVVIKRNKIIMISK